MAEEQKAEEQIVQPAAQEQPVILEERAVFNDLPKLDPSVLVITTQFQQQEMQLRHKQDLEKTQALHMQEEEKENNKALRKREGYQHWVDLGKDMVVTVFFIVVVSAILLYTGQRITDPTASLEEKKIAYGIWGTTLGLIVGFFAGRKWPAGGK